jgi:hypothetical protein
MQETKDLLLLIAKIGNGISEARKDGKWDISDVMCFGPSLAAIPAAISGAGDIGAEWAASTDADREELVDFFSKEFSISNAAAEVAIEKALSVAVAIYNLIK